MKRTSFPQILFMATMVTTLLLESCSTGSKSGSDEATPTPLPTSAALANPTYTVQRGEVVGTVDFTGRITPVAQQQLFFSIDGRIRTVYIQEGDTVKAGTVIADLEGAAELQRQLEMRQINLQRSQTNAEIAKLNFDLFVAQTPKGSATYDKLLAIEQAKLKLAQLDVQEASLGIQELQDSLSKTQLVSPMDGKVLTLDLSAGSQIHAYDSLGTVADISQVEVGANVTDINLLNQLEIGMSATLLKASGLGNPITGSVRHISLASGSAQPQEQDGAIRISLGSPAAEAGYQIGDLVNVTVIVVRKTDVLWVPPQIIRTYAGRKFVVVQDGDLQRRVDVVLGVIGEDRVEIVKGLSEGQVVVSP